MKWLEIGTYISKNENKLKIRLHDGYEKALIKLELFSHCLLILLREQSIEVKVVKIDLVDDKNGIVEVSGIQDEVLDLSGQLIDIKPYYPNEEVIIDDKLKNKNNSILVNYTGEIIGEYVIKGKSMHLEFDKKQKQLETLKKGDYLRIIWWFHRFDKDSFRKNRMCNPPYNNAPKSGIFATRSPVRPNPIASTIVKVVDYNSDNNLIEILGFDGFSGSKILQVMRYNVEERVKDAILPPWVEHWTPYKEFKKPLSIEINNLNNIDNDLKLKYENYEHPDISALGDVEEEYFHNQIKIKKAHIHNLKNINVTIPKNEITLITGVSGSGKSSLVFDTLNAESQKHFMDLVLSNQMGGDVLSESYVDKITGLQPSIAIRQKNFGFNPRSTVGTTTRITELIRLLYSTLGVRICPDCHKVIDESNVCGCGTIIFDRTPQMFSYNHPDFMCPVCKGLGVEMSIDPNLIVEHPEKSLLDKASAFYGDLRKHQKKPNANWMRGEVLALAEDMKVDLNTPYKDLPDEFKQQFLYGSKGREVSLAYKNSNGRSGVITRPVEGAVNIIYRLAYESKSKTSIENVKRFMTKNICSRCQGERLLEEGRLVHIQDVRYPEVMKMSIDSLRRWCHKTYKDMTETERQKSVAIFKKINARLLRIESVGLAYISLDRSIPSLSGGETQRLKLATQFGTGLSNILYIMDEPSKGLHPKDYRFLMEAILDLKERGNTVVIVEHKDQFKSIADYHITMGPKAGRYGGEILSAIKMPKMQFKNKEQNILLLDKKNSGIDSFIEMHGVETNNLKKINVQIPIGKMTAVVGVSGSGKSSLISKTLLPYLENYLNRTVEDKGKCLNIVGIENIKDVSFVSQKPIGNNSRSNPATYTGVFNDIRECYSKLDISKEKGFGKEHFSFNSKKGQCKECSGLGEIAVNMHYMDDISIPCSACKGLRYNPEVLKVKRNGYSIGDILRMEISDIIPLFKEEKEIYDKLLMFEKVGLGYLNLGQSAPTLSGGESQRIKLAKELYRKSCEGVLFILDEPTTGLHKLDTVKIINVLKELNDKESTIIIISHNMQLIKECDYAIELGPGGGHMGGNIVREGYISREN